MFPRSQRVRLTREIMLAFRQGEKTRQGAVSIFVVPKANDSCRATVIVDKKVSKKAVDRNLIKRRIRAILKQSPLRPGITVVRAYPGAEKLDYQELEKAVTACLVRTPSQVKRS